MEATMLLSRSVQSGSVSTVLMPSPFRDAARKRLLRKKARDIGKAALGAILMTAVVAAIVALKWIVWGGYFSH
jgi:hypothetical protein